MNRISITEQQKNKIEEIYLEMVFDKTLKKV